MIPKPANRTVHDYNAPSQRSIIFRSEDLPTRETQKSISYRERFKRQDWCATAQYAKPVLLRLLVENKPARQRHNASSDALRPELARRLESDADLRACGHDRQMLVLLFVHDVAALGGQFNRRLF